MRAPRLDAGATMSDPMARDSISGQNEHESAALDAFRALQADETGRGGPALAQLLRDLVGVISATDDLAFPRLESHDYVEDGETFKRLWCPTCEEFVGYHTLYQVDFADSRNPVERVVDEDGNVRLYDGSGYDAEVLFYEHEQGSGKPHFLRLADGMGVTW